MDSSPASDRVDTLDYIKSMLGELRTMALSESCDMLAFLIEVAYLEASDQQAERLKASGRAEMKPRARARS